MLRIASGVSLGELECVSNQRGRTLEEGHELGRGELGFGLRFW
jgi:hypothetical protein